MSEHYLCLSSQVKDLLSRAQQTDTPSHEDFYHYQKILKERQEALQLLEQVLAKDEVQTKLFVTLKSRVYKTVGAAIVAKIGSDWVGNYKNLSPERQEAVRVFLTELRLLISWAAAQAKEVEKHDHRFKPQTSQ